jgi:hypothetical protein
LFACWFASLARSASAAAPFETPGASVGLQPILRHHERARRGGAGPEWIRREPARERGPELGAEARPVEVGQLGAALRARVEPLNEDRDVDLQLPFASADARFAAMRTVVACITRRTAVGAGAPHARESLTTG